VIVVVVFSALLLLLLLLQLLLLVSKVCELLLGADSPSAAHKLQALSDRVRPFAPTRNKSGGGGGVGGVAIPLIGGLLSTNSFKQTSSPVSDVTHLAAADRLAVSSQPLHRPIIGQTLIVYDIE